MTINIYTSGAYDYINAKSDQLKEYARLLGISSTAIAGAIAKENNDRIKGVSLAFFLTSLKLNHATSPTH